MNFKKIIAVFSITEILLTGCGNIEVSEKTMPETTVSETTVISHIGEETGAISDIQNIDAELKINFPRPSQNLKEGNSGDEVKWLQMALNKAMKADLSINGEFDDTTKSKVKEFQSRCELSVDGVVGNQTVSKLVSIVSGAENMPESTTAPPVTQPPVIATKPTITTLPATEAKRNQITFVLNKETKCIHNISSNCQAKNSILPENYDTIELYEDELPNYAGIYWACGICNKRYKNILPKPENLN